MLMLALIVLYNVTSSSTYNENGDLTDKRVLFLSSYSPSFETFFKQVEGLKSVLDKNRVTLDIEFMDSKRFYTDENYQNFYKSLKYKVDNSEKYDVVIVGDDNALSFVTEHEELFIDIPIVFLGINDIENAKSHSENSTITGIYESVSLSGTVELAQKLKPDAERVIALVDSTITGQAVKKEYDLLDDNSDDLVFESFDLSEMTYEELQSLLSYTTEKDILLLIAVRRDMTGEVVSFRDGLDIIFAATGQPVFCLYDFGLDEGLIGGEVVSFKEQGQKAGEIALEILSGEKISNINLVENSHMKILNYNLIEKYNLSTDNLPDDVIFINKEESVLKKYLPYIVGGIIIIVLQGLLIFYLYNNVQIRKSTEGELLNKKQELICSNDELAILNEEMLASNEELTDSNEKLSNAIVKIEEQNQEIFNLVYLDDLTKTKNRLAISELIDKWLANPYDNYSYAILFLDVDNFKLINDTFGHDFGDRIIIETGRRLATLETENIQIGRFGGDEFLIIFKDKNIDSISEFLYELEELFKEPFSIDNRSLFLTISVGVSLYPIHGIASKELIKKADMALYEAKKSGKNRSVIYNQSMIEDLEDKVLFQSYVRKAYNNKEFHMNYQPHFDLSKGKFTGVEALIRWRSSELGYVSPLKLIQASEEMGLIVDIGKWVLEEACLFSKRINQRLDESIIVAINISSVQMLHPDFIRDLELIIKKTEVNPDNLCLEMTETTLFEFTEGNAHIITKLKSMGLEIALDDFGTGYSSLSYFKDIPASTIKIDKVFIDNMVNNEFDKYTVKMIIDLAHQKKLSVIAEGVEEKEQVDLLKHMKCDIIQGYYYSRPLMASEVTELLLNQG